MRNFAAPTLLLLLAVVSLGSALDAVVGGSRPLTEQEENSGDFLNAVREATRRYNIFSNSMYHHAMLRYEDATQQVVAGRKYKFSAIFVETPCRKSAATHHHPLSRCQQKPSQDASLHRCDVEVLYRPWTKPQYDVSLGGCSRQRRLQRRSLQRLQHRVIVGAGDERGVGNAVRLAEFREFKRRHSRVYASESEEQRRFAIFNENMQKALAYQTLDLGSATYGASPFADLTEEEFRTAYLSPAWDLGRRPARAAVQLEVGDLPGSFDWRDKGAVTKVKNQGSCGSCWAFSTTGNIEGQWFLKKKQLVSLSEQELVDCDKVDEGCNGGLPSQAYKEIQRIGGLMSEQLYPYKGRDAKCRFDSSKVAAYVNGSVAISKNEAQMAAWLVQNGPISIGINANAMQFYLGGVSHPWKIFCNPGHLDHGVLIVGYGKKGSEPYWIVKNSWGSTWGASGYYLVYRGDGTCGLNQMCTSAVVN